MTLVGLRRCFSKTFACRRRLLFGNGLDQSVRRAGIIPVATQSTTAPRASARTQDARPRGRWRAGSEVIRSPLITPEMLAATLVPPPRSQDRSQGGPPLPRPHDHRLLDPLCCITHPQEIHRDSLSATAHLSDADAAFNAMVVVAVSKIATGWPLGPTFSPGRPA